MLNRKYKILPHEFLEDYRYSIYIDANIQITGDVCKLFTQHLNDEPLAVAEHPRRDCIYEEAEACVKKNLANKDDVNQQMSRYRSEGFPEKYGLTENRVSVDHIGFE